MLLSSGIGHLFPALPASNSGADLRNYSTGAAEQREVEKRLAVCLEQGSIGLSTGLNEVPSSYGDFDELVNLCRVVRQDNAFYTSHLRDCKFAAIHKATGLPAQRFNLRQGFLREGYHANFIVFSPAEIGTQGSYAHPNRQPQGIEHVLVNGAWAVRQGRVQQSFLGRAVRN